jgi:hypothetical protein
VESSFIEVTLPPKEEPYHKLYLSLLVAIVSTLPRYGTSLAKYLGVILSKETSSELKNYGVLILYDHQFERA